MQDSLDVRQQVDRVVAARKGKGGLEYLVKWFFQPYKESTWEVAESVLTSTEDREAIER